MMSNIDSNKGQWFCATSKPEDLLIVLKKILCVIQFWLNDWSIQSVAVWKLLEVFSDIIDDVVNIFWSLGGCKVARLTIFGMHWIEVNHDYSYEHKKLSIARYPIKLTTNCIKIPFRLYNVEH